MPREQRIKDCTRLIELGKLSRENLSIAYSNRGASYRTIDNERALRDLVKAIELNDKSSTAYYSRGLALISIYLEDRSKNGRDVNKEKLLRAMADYLRSVEIEP